MPARALQAVWYGRSAWRWLLWPASLVFVGLARLREALYGFGALRSVELPVPVVVVGNISVGGTGKTPIIVWLAGQLESRGIAAGIVSRGYRGVADSWPQWVQADSDPRRVGDEPVLLAGRTGRPVVAGPDRVAAGRYLLSKRAVDVLLSDDGLQHYRLRRAFEIAIVDGRRGFGNGLCLPAGPLREAPSRLTQVDAVVVMNGPREEASAWSSGRIGQHRLVDPSRGPDIEQSLDAKTYRATLEPTRVYRLTGGDEASLGDFAGRKVHAVAGIGHPDRFFEMLERAGAIVARHPLPDHAQIRAADLLFEPGVPVMITEKDAVKCRDIANENVWCVAVDVLFEPEDAQRLLDAVLAVLKRGDGSDGSDGGDGEGRSYNG